MKNHSNISIPPSSNKDMLTVMTCGSVDDGKSTLIGRLLWDMNQVFEDQKLALIKDSERFGTQGKNLDYALLVDGLSAEREQGITIDVAYRYFTSPSRKFIIGDTPGHEQYTRNMVTAASNADAAIILVDAQKGILNQTKRHTALLALMRVPHVMLAINKMDLCSDPETTYQNITQEFETYAQCFPFSSLVSIPIIAVHGDNIAVRSHKMDWYTGSTLLGHLETLETSQPIAETMTFPIQWVNRPNSHFRGYAGTIASGKISVGDNLRLIRSGEVTTVAKIISNQQEVEAAVQKQAITICLDREIDVSRGDVFTLDQRPIDSSDTFAANLVWMNPEPGYTGRSYILKMAHKTVRTQIVTLKHKLDIVHQSELSAKDIQCNDIVKVVIRTSERIAFTPYSENKTLGGFILIDPVTKMTIAAGTIDFSMRRSTNTHTQALTIQRQQREELNGHKGLAIWLTGLSGSGKSTIANQLEQELHSQGVRTYVLDGDNVRQGLCKDLGFTPTDRIENIRRIAELTSILVDAGIVVIVATISPYAADRQMAKDTIGSKSFLEVYVDTPLEVCEQRDPKGLYKKARRGELPGFTGIDSPYEVPKKPDFTYKESTNNTRILFLEVMRLIDHLKN